MAVLLAAFDNATKAIDILAKVEHTPFEQVILRKSRLRVHFYTNSAAEADQLKTAFPNLKVNQTSRLLDNNEGAARGTLLGIVTGAILIQFIGWTLYYLLQNPVARLEQGAGLNLGSQGALIALFMGFFGAVIGGVIGFLTGRNWIGLPPEIAHRYEYRLERGEVVLALNQRRLLRDGPRRIRLGDPKSKAMPQAFTLERFHFWLGEQGAHDTRRVRGSVAALHVTAGIEREVYASPLFYQEDDEEERQ